MIGSRRRWRNVQRRCAIVSQTYLADALKNAGRELNRHGYAFRSIASVRILDQRLQFLPSYQNEEMSVADLCRAYGRLDFFARDDSLRNTALICDSGQQISSTPELPQAVCNSIEQPNPIGPRVNGRIRIAKRPVQIEKCNWSFDCPFHVLRFWF